MSFEILALLTVILFGAGAVKGAVGLGLPTIAIGFMTLFIDPRAAIAYFMFPMLMTNAWQVFRQGEVLRTFWRYLPFSSALAIFVILTVFLSKDAPDRLLFAVLGAVILAFVATQKIRFLPQLSDKFDVFGQLSMGFLAGILGGLVGIWAPPMVVYLSARQTEKDEFVRASGLIILMGSVPLALGYMWTGLLDAQTSIWSLLLVIPTIFGFAIGERLRQKLSEAAFKSLLLWVFFFMGLNLLRRAVMG